MMRRISALDSIADLQQRLQDLETWGKAIKTDEIDLETFWSIQEDLVSMADELEGAIRDAIDRLE